METGKVEPRMDTIRLIASAFEVSPDYLIGMSSKPYYSLNKEEWEGHTKRFRAYDSTIRE